MSVDHNDRRAVIVQITHARNTARALQLWDVVTILDDCLDLLTLPEYQYLVPLKHEVN